MLKILVKKWDKNKDKLRDYIINNPKFMNDCTYDELVKMTFEIIFNDGEDEQAHDRHSLDLNRMTSVDNGNYQGTLLYIIPFNTYQPDESEYLMTYVGYGSCSYCDTLLGIQEYPADKPLTNEQIEGFMQLCLDILRNTIKPYNNGWRKEEEYEHVEFKEVCDE